MAAAPKQILSHLRECYRENGSRGGLWNVFGSSVYWRVPLKGADFLASRPEAEDARYLRSPDVAQIARAAAFHRKEKDLLHISLFLIGWVERFEGKPEALCAPLFLHPASLSTEGLEQGASLSIDPSRRQVNSAVLEAVGGVEFAAAIEAAVEADSLTEGCVGEIRRLFTERFPDSDTSALFGYPALVDEETLRASFEAAKESHDAPLRLLPCAALVLVDKSTEMRGVLNELEAMAAPELALSTPVRALLGESPPPAPAAPAGRVPTTLSAAQEKALHSARSHALTLVVGPPGTGKSFTIAALAIETLSRGGSVLIASKMDHAVDVVGNKIESAIGLEGVVTRGGRSRYLSRLKRFLDDLLSGLHTADAPDLDEVTGLGNRLRDLEQRIDGTTRRLARELSEEALWGRWFLDPSPGWFTRWRRNRLWKKLAARPTVWQSAAELESAIDQRHEDTIRYLRAARLHFLAERLRHDRPSLQQFSRAIRARTGTQQATHFDQMALGSLLGALPVWLVNLSDAHRVLPLETEAFDLAIIDEATQCDMASALPVLQRARRAVIVGDPKQLRHLSFLPRARQDALAEQFGLDAAQRETFDFRRVSLLDLASETIVDQNQVAFLNEHFRSQPEIIAFSNREFYGGRLHVMTGHRRATAPSAEDGGRAVQVTTLGDGEARRLKNGSNPVEAKAVIAAVEAVLAAQGDLAKESVHSIGILSPFRDQVEHLRRVIARHPAAEALLQRHDLLIGTAHSFQGEERDLMFLSLALDDESSATSFRFLDKEDVFNVSITRARLLNRLWCSFSPERLKAGSLLARYLHEAQRGMPGGETDPVANRAHDAFACEVANVLRDAGAVVHLAHPLAGMEIDLVYTLGGITRGIDLVGYPGAMAEAFPLERVLIFRRAGLPILPLPYSSWMRRREPCVDWLLGRGG